MLASSLRDVFDVVVEEDGPNAHLRRGVHLPRR